MRNYRTTGARRTSTLATRFDPRTNSLNAVRLALAAVVLLSHSMKFAGWEDDPLGRVTGTDVDLGTVAVDGFFLLSGFLITRSYLTSPSLARYLWRRCLRILPAFWVCLLVTATIFAPLAAWLEHGRPDAFAVASGPDSALSYLVNNAALHMRQWTIGGLLGGEALNGSLHTLFYEFLCYLMVGALGVLGVLRLRPSLVLALTGTTWTFAAVEVASGGLVATSPGRELLLRFTLMFLVGASLLILAPRVAISRTYAVSAAALLVLSMLWADANLLLAPAALGYLLLVIGTSRRLAHIGRRRDLSYGLYIYAWPVQMLLLLAGVAAWSLAVYVTASLAAALTMAWLSWHLVEARALALKSWSPKQRASLAMGNRR